MPLSDASLTRMQHGPRFTTEGTRPVFSLHGVGKTYLMGEVRVATLADVDLELVESEFVVLLGASGSGKSTLLNILGGLDTPTVVRFPTNQIRSGTRMTAPEG